MEREGNVERTIGKELENPTFSLKAIWGRQWFMPIRKKFRPVLVCVTVGLFAVDGRPSPYYKNNTQPRVFACQVY